MDETTRTLRRIAETLADIGSELKAIRREMQRQRPAISDPLEQDPPAPQDPS